MGDEVTIKDVYELVDSSRKELSDQIKDVNGDVVDLQVQVGKVETQMEAQNGRIEANTNGLTNMRDKIHDQRVKAAQIGGLAGVVITAILRGIEWLLAQAGA